MEFNANFKKWARNWFTGVSEQTHNVLGNSVSIARSANHFMGTMNDYTKYSMYYDGSTQATGTANFPTLIVGSGTPSSYSLGNPIVSTVLKADSKSTGVWSGTTLTVNLVLRNISSNPVIVSEIGIYAVALGTSSNIIAKPGDANTIMIGSGTVDPVSIDPGEHVNIRLNLDFPEVTE